MSNPRQTEATSSTATVEFKGEKFTIPVEYDDYPLSFIEAMADEAPLVVQSRELLGPDQWVRVRALNLKGADLDVLSDAIRDAVGVSTGESAPSSD